MINIFKLSLIGVFTLALILSFALIGIGSANAALTIGASSGSFSAISTYGTAAGDFTIEAGTTTPASLILISDEDSTDAINIDATAGGMDIDAVGAAGQDINILNTGGSLFISSNKASFSK